MKKVQKTDLVFILFILVFSLGIFQYNDKNPITLTLIHNESLGYAKAMVTEVVEEDAREDDTADGRYYGIQTIKAVILQGEFKGKEAVIDNYLSTTHNVRLHTGQYFIACIDSPKEADSLITVYSYHRTPVIYLFAGILIGLMVLIGKGKGIRSAVSLIFTMYTILAFMLPLIFNGYSPVGVCVLTVIITAAVSLFLLNGNHKKTWVATIATGTGVILSGIVFQIMAALIHVNGFNTDQAEALILIAQNTGLQISQVLFAGILISSLGAVMDVGLSIASALCELTCHNPEITSKELFYSGLHVGKDMIGTMCNTLILAFTGSSLTTLLMLRAYGVDYIQLMNSDFIAMEAAQGISGTIAIIMTVPIGAALAAAVYTRNHNV
jgi:uncharacterized membrane protein